jgi:arylsulfatase A-like enzyme
MLPLAEVMVDTAVIDFGDPEARPLLIDGWGVSERVDGESFAWGLGASSTVEIEIAWPRPIELIVESEPYVFPGAPAQVVDVLLNGENVGEIAMATGGSGAERYRLDLPVAAQRAGTNRLEFRYAYSRSPREVDSRSQDPRPLAVAWHTLRLGGAVDAHPQVRGDALLLPPFSGVSFYLRLPQGGRVTVDEGLRWRDWGGLLGSDAALTVSVAMAGAPTSVEERVVALADLEGFALELPASPSAPVRLTLSAASPGGGGTGLRLVAPRLHLPEPLEADGANADLASAGERPNVLIYMIDTLRADHLGCYGYDRPTSPEIDRFASEATLFTAAQAQSPWTRPSVASLFTGLYPQVHGTNGRDDALPEEAVPVAELLHGVGYQTAAVITNGNVNKKFGFARGFESFTWLRERAETAEVHELSDRVNEATFGWLEKRDRERPFFLYLHTTDPHGPYMPRSPYRERFAPGVTDPEAGSNDRIAALGRPNEPVDPEVLADLVGLYDAEIAFNDAAFGALMEKLRELDLYDSTLVVLLSDHGEEFKEHGRMAHGKSLFGEQLSVPLVVRFPDGRGQGERITGTARQVDVLPTILEYLGETVSQSVQGRSLLPMVAGIDPDRLDEPSYSYVDLDGRRIESVGTRERKLIHYLEFDQPRPPLELFDVSRDLSEQSDLATTEPVWRGYLYSLLRYRREFWRALDAPQVETDEELRRRLRAAGYLE